MCNHEPFLVLMNVALIPEEVFLVLDRDKLFIEVYHFEVDLILKVEQTLLKIIWC